MRAIPVVADDPAAGAGNAGALLYPHQAAPHGLGRQQVREETLQVRGRILDVLMHHYMVLLLSNQLSWDHVICAEGLSNGEKLKQMP